MKIKAYDYARVNENNINKQLSQMALSQFKKGEKIEEKEDSVNPLVAPLQPLNIPTQKPTLKSYSITRTSADKVGLDEFIRKSNYLLNDVDQTITVLGLNRPAEIYGGAEDKVKKKRNKNKPSAQPTSAQPTSAKPTPAKLTPAIPTPAQLTPPEEKQEEPPEIQTEIQQMEPIHEEEQIEQDLGPFRYFETDDSDTDYDVPVRQVRFAQQQMSAEQMQEITDAINSLPHKYTSVEYNHKLSLKNLLKNPRKLSALNFKHLSDFINTVIIVSGFNADEFVKNVYSMYSQLDQMEKNIVDWIVLRENSGKVDAIYNKTDLINAMIKYVPNFSTIYRRKYSNSSFNEVDRKDLLDILKGNYTREELNISMTSKDKDLHTRIKTINNLVDDLLISSSSLNKFKGADYQQISKIKNLYEKIAQGLEVIISINPNNSQILKLKSSFQSLYDAVGFAINNYVPPNSISGGSINVNNSFVYIPKPKPKTDTLYYL